LVGNPRNRTRHGISRSAYSAAQSPDLTVPNGLRVSEANRPSEAYETRCISSHTPA